MSRSQDKTLQSVAYHKRRALNKAEPVSQTKLFVPKENLKG